MSVAKSRVGLLSLVLVSVVLAAPVAGSMSALPWAVGSPDGTVDVPQLNAVQAAPADSLVLSTGSPQRGEAGARGEMDDVALRDDLRDRYNAAAGEAVSLAAIVHGEADDPSAPAASLPPTTVQSAPQAPLHWNATENITHGPATWDPVNKTLTVEAGNFLHHGVNCSWEAFTWSPGEDFLSLLNITCDFWGLFTVSLVDGTATVTWSNGSWNHTFDAPPAPELYESEWSAALQHVAEVSVSAASPAVSPRTAPTISL